MAQPADKIASTATKLQDLALPCLAVILEELFFVPPEFLGPPPLNGESTIAELIAFSELKEAEVLRSLRELQQWCAGIIVDQRDAASLLKNQQEYTVIDIRDAQLAQGSPIAHALRINPETFYRDFDQLAAAQKTLLVISDSLPHAFSGALYLKQQGLKKVRCLSLGKSEERNPQGL